MSALESGRPTRSHAGHVTARFASAPGHVVPAAQHLPAIVLIDETLGEAVSLDYQANLTPLTGTEGRLDGVRLTLPQAADCRRSSPPSSWSMSFRYTESACLSNPERA